MKLRMLLLVLAVGMIANLVSGQGIEYLDINNVKAGFSPSLTFFNDTGQHGYSQYEVPKGSGIKSIFSSSIWLSGLDAVGNLKGCGNRYDTMMAFGPIATVYNSAYINRYNRVWKVTRTDIQNHTTHYFHLGYTVPSVIADWPGNGNTANGEAAILAPFIDFNHNGLYEPILGDYPDICGDQAIFMMYNDSSPFQSLAGNFACQKMNVELHVLAYSFASSPAKELYNTIFLKASVFNRSNAALSDVRFSNFIDPDLGCPYNDRMGCDTSLNSFFVYNGESAINSCDTGSYCNNYPLGYGCTKPSQGFTFLNKSMSSFICGAFNFTNIDPNSCATARNFQIGRWLNGTHITYGGNGYGGTIPTDFVYTGNPADSTQWSELHTQNATQNPSGDRRGLGSVKIDSFLPNTSFTVDMAYVTSFMDSTAPYLSEITKLKQDIYTIRNLYTKGNLCSSSLTAVQEVVADEVAIHPNPTTSIIQLQVGSSLIGSSYILYDLLGRVMQSSTVHSQHVTIDMVNMDAGMYLLTVGCMCYKVMKE